jgi:5-methylcytosine-specific restriction protein A
VRILAGCRIRCARITLDATLLYYVWHRSPATKCITAGAHVTFTIGEIFKRRDLHARFGGQQQGGISTPAEHALILLFTGDSGHLYGYEDGPQPDGTFWYTGEGQVGDMPMVRGNLAIRDHAQNGKELHLFEDIRQGNVRYLGPASYAGHHDEVAADRNGSPRKALVLELSLDLAPSATAPGLVEAVPDDDRLWRQSLDALRAAALTPAPPTASPAVRKANAYHRSNAVRVYVLKRANGKCEACGRALPQARELLRLAS